MQGLGLQVWGDLQADELFVLERVLGRLGVAPVQGLGFRVPGSGFRIKGLGSGFRV